MTGARLRHAVRLRVEPSTEARPLLNLEQIESGTGRVLGDLEISAPSGSIRFEPGDVLFSKLRPYLAKSVRVQVAMHGTGELLAMTAGPNIDSRYLMYVTLSTPWLETASLTAYGTKMPRTSWEAMADFRLPDLRLDHQRQIADFLDDQVARIDNIIAARRAQLGLIGETLTASLDALFDGSPRPLRTMLAQTPCYGVLVPKFVDTGVPFIRVNDLQRLDDGHELAQIERAQSIEYRRTVVEQNDVLVSVVGSIDKSAIVSGERAGANVARAVARLRPARSVPSTVIHGWLSTTAYRDQARLATGGDTAQPTLNMGDLSGFRIAVPDGDLSLLGRRIMKVRDHAAAATDLLASSAGLLGELKRSLITTAVTGDFDVSTADGSRVSA